MAQYYSPDQMQVLSDMMDVISVSGLGAQDNPGVETILASIRSQASAGNYEADSLLAIWEYWQRYETGLVTGRHDRAEAVAMMIYDAGKAIGSPDDWSAPQPTTIANAYLEGRA